MFLLPITCVLKPYVPLSLNLTQTTRDQQNYSKWAKFNDFNCYRLTRPPSGCTVYHCAYQALCTPTIIIIINTVVDHHQHCCRSVRWSLSMQTNERRVQCSNENHSKRSLNERVSGMRSERKERTTVHALSAWVWVSDFVNVLSSRRNKIRLWCF